MTQKREQFYCLRDRYYYDNKLCPEGWHQFDTDQDASYFGVWTNWDKLQTLTFAEGDETLVTCDTAEEFKQELADMAKFYGAPPPAFRAIDSNGQVTHYFDKRDS